MRLTLALWWLLAAALAPTAAEAAPVAAAISAVAAFIASSGIAKFLVSAVASFALSALSRALAPKPRPTQRSISTTITTRGERNPETFPLGRYATAGQLAYVGSYGGSSGHQNKVLVIALSAIKGVQLLRVGVNDRWVPLDTASPDPDLGYPAAAGDDLAGYFWVKFYDGTQVAADDFLVTTFGSDPDYPWDSTHVGAGVAYAIVTLKFSTEKWSGEPRLRFELEGIPLYDPRQDDTAGGSGTMRWDDPSTWAPTRNPIVMVYNILRGIDIGAGETWGGSWEAADLPYGTWAAAMDSCDELVDDGTGGQVPRYEAGFEVPLDPEQGGRPADVIEELLKACSGALAEVGGQVLVRAGAPALAAGSLTDGELLVTEGKRLSQSPGIGEAHNTVRASWIDPEAVYDTRDADEYTDPTALTEDGNLKVVGDVALPAVLRSDQVTRLQREWLADDRRWRVHQLGVLRAATALEPFDVLSWTSGTYGYAAAPWEVIAVTSDPKRLTQSIKLREIDYADWS